MNKLQLTPEAMQAKRTLFVTLLVASSIMAVLPYISIAHATSYSVNVLNNNSFENGVDPSTGYPLGWGNWTHHATPDATLTADCSGTVPPVDGACEARLEMGQTVQFGIGFIAIFQVMASNTFFSNLTDRPDGLDVWLYFQPKYAGLGDFKVTILAQNAQEMDYVLDPDPYLSYPNQTFPITYPNGTVRSGTTPLVKSIIKHGYPAGQWLRFTADIKADWVAPMMYTNASGTYTLPGFPLNDIMYRLEFDSVAFRNDSTQQYFAQIVWIDQVKFYEDSLTPPPPPQLHWISFNFTDSDGNNVDNQLQWKLYNSTGAEIPYTRGQSALPSGTYSLEAYYPAYSPQYPDHDRILRVRIPLDLNSTIRLPMTPQASSPGGYIAFNSNVTVSIIQQTPTNLTFTASAAAGNSFLAIVGTPRAPSIVQRDSVNLQASEWSIDQYASAVRITSTQLGRFSLYFGPAITLPTTLSFADRLGNSVNITTWRILNSQSRIVCAAVACLGESVPQGTYVLEAYFSGYPVYKQPVVFDSSDPIRLQMTPLTIVKGGYLTLNNTLTSASLTEQSGSRIVFTLEGATPSLIVVSVPKKPLYVDRNGVRVFDWVFNSASGTVAIETDTLGTFSLVLESPSFLASLEEGQLLTYLIIGAVGTLAIIGTTIVWRRGKMPRPGQTLNKETFKR